MKRPDGQDLFRHSTQYRPPQFAAGHESAPLFRNRGIKVWCSFFSKTLWRPACPSPE